MNIGQRIRKQRETLNLTQRELAQVLKVTPQHISAIEQNKRVPSLNFLAKLAEQLGVSIDYLVSGKNIQGEIVLDSFIAIKADKSLTAKAKRGLLALLEELQGH